MKGDRLLLFNVSWPISNHLPNSARHQHQLVVESLLEYIPVLPDVSNVLTQVGSYYLKVSGASHLGARLNHCHYFDMSFCEYNSL